MHVQNAREVPEYEIDHKELDFSDSFEITKVSYKHFSTGCLLFLFLVLRFDKKMCIDKWGGRNAFFDWASTFSIIFEL